MLQAGLVVAGSEVPVPSNAVTVEFDNTDGVHVTADYPGNKAVNPSTGDVWYGGPGGSTFAVTVIPVRYSGGAVESVGIRNFCGADLTTKAEAPYEFSVDCEKYSGSSTPEFVLAVGGQTLEQSQSEALNDTLFPINLDFKAPTAPVFKVNPGDPARADGWINAAVDLVGENKSSNKNGWLTYNDDDSEGVGGYIPQLRYATSDPSVVASARAAAASANPALPAVSKKDRICFIATATDLLGNESALPSASKECVDAEKYAGLATDLKTALDADEPDADDIADARKALANVGLRGGVDVTAPTAEFARSGLDEDARELDEEFVVEVVDEDDGSGINEGDPFIASLTIRDADGTKCIIDGKPSSSTRLCSDPFAGYAPYDDGLVSTDGLDDPDDDDKYTGYYTFTGQAQDRAGNLSAEISQVALSDTQFDARASLRVRGDRNDPYDYAVDITVDDDLSVRDYSLTVASIDGTDAVEVVEDVGMRFLMGDVEEVDAYNAADLTTDHSVSEAITLPFLAVQTAAAGDRTTLTDFEVYVRDQREAASDVVAFDARGGSIDAATGTGLYPSVVMAFAGIDAGELGTEGNELDDGDDIEFTITVDVPEDTESTHLDETDAPFKRIYLYAESSEDNDGPVHLRLIDSFAKTAYDEGADGTPEYVYEVEINAGDLFAMVDDDGKGAYAGKIIAIGVQNDLEALDAIVAGVGPDGESDTDDDIAQEDARSEQEAASGVGLFVATADIFIDP